MILVGFEHRIEGQKINRTGKALRVAHAMTGTREGSAADAFDVTPDASPAGMTDA